MHVGRKRELQTCPNSASRPCFISTLRQALIVRCVLQAPQAYKLRILVAENHVVIYTKKTSPPGLDDEPENYGLTAQMHLFPCYHSRAVRVSSPNV